MKDNIELRYVGGNLKSENLTISSISSIKDAIEKISLNGKQIVCMIDEGGKFLGTITDGDIRRGLLKGFSLSDAAMNVLQKDCFWLTEEDKKSQLKIQPPEGVTQVPILDHQMKLVDLISISQMERLRYESIPVVIMAGGKGERLRPLTNHVPKPMIQIGGTPVLEKLIKRLKDQGFLSVTLVVNYLADEIINYFDNGEKFGLRITYIRESDFRGTAGSLSEITKDESLGSPILIVNSDLITEVNFQNLVDFYFQENAQVLVGASNYEFTIPYGVLEQVNGRVQALLEKPKMNFLISSGIYCVDFNLLSIVPRNGIYSMPDLLNDVMKKNIRVVAFPIHENWIDIGRHMDLEKAKLLHNES